MAKLEYKLEITGKITVKTGLHIGGSDVDLTIGGIDSEVAKNKADGTPYIPGSSLSGKLRSLIAKAKGYKYLNFNAAREAYDIESLSWDKEYTALLFAGTFYNILCKKKKDRDDKPIKYKHRRTDEKFQDYENISNNKISKDIELATYTRLLVRDSFLLSKFDENTLEDKAENTINRNTGEANPRHIERVVRETEFGLNMTLDVYENDDVIQMLETLHLGINLLNNDYLGGMGSRGSGAVEVIIKSVDKLVFTEGSIERTNFTDYSFNPSTHENSPNTAAS